MAETLKLDRRGEFPRKATSLSLAPELEVPAFVLGPMRRGLAESGKFTILDIAPVNAAAHAANLQACGGCDVDLAQKLGADIAMTGVVHKVSNLILRLHIYLRDAHTGRLITLVSTSFRGNTDESWQRGHELSAAQSPARA